jgi:hypothetical protein
MFCTPLLVFSGTEGVGSCFHVLRARIRFRWYRGRRVPFSCFARPNSFSAVPTTSGLVFMFCALGLVFGGTEGVGSRFHILRARTRFRRYRGSQVPFSCFVRLYSFSAVPRASGPVFIFCALGLVSRSTEGVGSRFDALRARTHFRRYRGRQDLFSCFARPNSFSAVPTASGPVFMFCAPVLVFVGTEGVGSRFHVLRSWTHFRRYLGRRLLFSCFVHPNSFLALPRAWALIFMFCAPDLVFGGTECVGSRFHLLCSQTRFGRCGGRMLRVSFFVLPETFSTVRRASSPVFMFCAPGFVFDGIKGVVSCFHVLRSRTRFPRYRGRQVPFSCFARPYSFSAVTTKRYFRSSNSQKYHSSKKILFQNYHYSKIIP